MEDSKAFSSNCDRLDDDFEDSRLQKSNRLMDASSAVLVSFVLVDETTEFESAWVTCSMAAEINVALGGGGGDAGSGRLLPSSCAFAAASLMVVRCLWNKETTDTGRNAKSQTHKPHALPPRPAISTCAMLRT